MCEKETRKEKREREKKGLLRNKERATSAQVQSIGPFERQLRWRVRRSCRCRSQRGGACNAKAARAPTSSGWLTQAHADVTAQAQQNRKERESLHPGQQTAMSDHASREDERRGRETGKMESESDVVCNRCSAHLSRLASSLSWFPFPKVAVW